MFPPSAPIYWNTRPRWQGSNEISRKKLMELKEWKHLKIERIRINQNNEPEYVVITYENGAFIVDALSPSVRKGYICRRNFMDLIDYLTKELGFVIVI